MLRSNLDVDVPNTVKNAQMRLFAASLATETNPFSPLPTSLEAYQDCVWFRPGEHPAAAPSFGTDMLWVARRRAVEEGFTLVEGSCFGALPAGMTTRIAYETMRDEIISQLKSAMPLDGVLLGLHGAMVAVGYEDVEGDILEHVRDVVGPDCVVGVELDPHCHLTIKRLKLSDVVVTYKEYPHTDMVERADEVLSLVLQTIRGEIDPVTSVFDCRQIATYLTTLEPMRSLVDRIKSMEGKDGILSISVAHGFPWADVPELSTRVIVVTDGNKQKADAVASSIGAELVSMRGKTMPTYHSIADGLRLALESPDRPVMVTDTSDAAGAGAPGDSTHILRYLIEQGVDEAALGAIWDPVAVRLCFDAGEDAELALRFGGKLAPSSGQPMDAKVKVIGLKRDSGAQHRFSWGDSAAIRIDGIDVVLTSNRALNILLDLFTNVGIDPLKKKVVVIKTARPLVGPAGPIAAPMVDVDGEGLQAVDFRKIPYARVKRPIWPLDNETSPALVF